MNKVLIDWFISVKRDFPWRENISPYKVWVSEVMLQQTKASVVIPYFEKWMELFPTIKDLANAPLDQVIKAWEGLGYYTRAKNLHIGAKKIISEYRGQFPSIGEEIEKIPGIGPYTTGAILSFAFQKKAVAIDGNVQRVISRLYCIENLIDKEKKQIEKHVLTFLPEKKAYVVMEALIELGATICQKKPKCSICPLKNNCLAFKNQIAEKLPIKKKREKVISLKRALFIIEHKGFLLVQKVVEKKIMAGLYEFPYLPYAEKVDIEKLVYEKFNLLAALQKCYDEITHHFTKYRSTLYPYYLKVLEKKSIDGFQWIQREDLKNLPFSSGHRKVLQGYNEDITP